ncbi:MAG: putative acetyl xylan esterase, partial [Bryobacterales bacterium]|nr:putative acetyl xylan esterase [Bryobacterales bacterium]
MRPTLLLLPLTLFAQAHPEYNYDESKVAPYTLPDPLILQNGKPVRDAATWNRQRRPELLRLFEEHVYGRTPRKHLSTSVELLAPDAPALDGAATRRQVRIYFSQDKSGPKMDLLIYIPAGAKKPVSAFLGPNFSGNHTVASDPGIHLGQVWNRDPSTKEYHAGQASEKSRGSGA